MKNLVLGFATNQDEHSLRVFTKSLRNVYRESECDIVIVTNEFQSYFPDLSDVGVTFMGTPNNYSRHTGRLSKAINRLVLNSMRGLRYFRILERVAPEIARTYPVLLETWHHPHFVRWLAYRHFLSLNRGYEKVLLADVKDIVFQAPFFSEIARDCVSLFDQSETYGECYWDTRWYREAWGEQELQKVLGKSPVCIGTIAGPHSGVLSLVDELASYFVESPFGRIEQSVFNYLLLTNSIRTPYRVIPNITGPIATLANDWTHDQTRTYDGLIRRTSDGSPLPVVHMYDRFADTKAAYESFGLSPQTAL